MEILERTIEDNIIKSLSYFPVTALLGPRQVGKTTLAKKLCEQTKSIYLDLERPSDLAKLDDPETYLSLHKDKLVCLDEVQRKPDLFPILRSLIDEEKRPGKFLILGSASPNLLRQSSETLAGRISYLYVTPFTYEEMASGSDRSSLIQKALWRGGFPDSFLAPTNDLSFMWRENFVLTFLERDLAQMGVTVEAMQMRRLWMMCAHSQGQVVNYSKIGQSLGQTHPTVKKHIDNLEATFMLQTLLPWEFNTKKRLVKSPKIYVRDPGIFCSLMGIDSFEKLYGHPSYGSVWEGFAIANILARHPDCKEYGFLRTHNGDEIDLIMNIKGEIKAYEFKTSASVKIDKKILPFLDAIGCAELNVVVPELKEPFPILQGRGQVISLSSCG